MRGPWVTLTTAVAPLTWGTTYLVTTELLPPGRPLLAGLLRALPIGLLMMLIVRRLPNGIWWWRAAVLGTLNIGLFFALLFVAAYRLPGGVAATVGAAQPLLVAALAWPLLGDPITGRTMRAAGIGIVGVALLVLRAGARLDPVGLAAALAATASSALATVLIKRWGRPAPLAVVTAWQILAGGLFLLPLALTVEGTPPALGPANVAGLLYLALVNTALAYALWIRGIERLPVAAVAFLVLLSPVVATAGGWIVRGESLTPLQFAGAALIVVGVVAGQGTGTGRRVQRPGDEPAGTDSGAGVSVPPPTDDGRRTSPYD